MAGPCLTFREDPNVCYGDGEPKGQCANCGFMRADHSPIKEELQQIEQAFHQHTISELQGSAVPTEPGYWWRYWPGGRRWEPVLVVVHSGNLFLRQGTEESAVVADGQWGGRCLGMPTTLPQST